MSCNGCRVLRKGCGDDCIIRPCLQWIASADSQANATIFLAKFYGRAGLFNLITAASEQLRPAIFKSLLYEACGRMVNPVYGSVGLLWSGNWEKCQAAVDAVLTGSMNVESNAPPWHANLSLKCCDIRHTCNDNNLAISGDLRTVKTRSRFKKLDYRTKPKVGSSAKLGNGSNVAESEASHSQVGMSKEMVEFPTMNRTTLNPVWTYGSRSENRNVELELTLNSAQ